MANMKPANQKSNPADHQAAETQTWVTCQSCGARHIAEQGPCPNCGGRKAKKVAE